MSLETLMGYQLGWPEPARTPWAWILLGAIAAVLVFRHSTSNIPNVPLIGFGVKDAKKRKAQYSFNAPGIIQEGYEKVSFEHILKVTTANTIISSKAKYLVSTLPMVLLISQTHVDPHFDR